MAVMLSPCYPLDMESRLSIIIALNARKLFNRRSQGLHTRCGLNSWRCKVPPNTASAKASNSSVAFLNRFLQCKMSLTEPHNLQQLMTDDVYVFFGVCKLLSPDIAAEEHMFTYRST